MAGMVLNLTGLVLTLAGLVAVLLLSGRYAALMTELDIRLPAMTALLLQGWLTWTWSVLLLLLFGGGIALRKHEQAAPLIGGGGLVLLAAIALVHVLFLVLPLVELVDALQESGGTDVVGGGAVGP